jgi:hypothetical protein
MGGGNKKTLVDIDEIVLNKAMKISGARRIHHEGRNL